MRPFVLLVSWLWIVLGCRPAGQSNEKAPMAFVAGRDYFPHKATVRYANHFSVSYHGHYKVVRTSATLGEWGTPGGEVADAEDRMVLVQRGTPVPPLTGELSGATVMTIPATQRLAVNSSGLEIWLAMLGLENRLVAIGGTKPYNDSLRYQAETGRIGQVGYSWSAPPVMEVLLNQHPDLFLQVISRVGFNAYLTKARRLGIPTAPVFDWAEKDYLATAEWIKYCALFTNQEALANQWFTKIEQNVGRLKRLVAPVKNRPVCLWAHFVDSGFWMASSNNAEARLLKDAGVVNPTEDFSRPFSPVGESFTHEQFLRLGHQADYWIIGSGTNTHLPANARYLNGFTAWRTGRLYHHHKRSKPDYNAYDWFNLWPVRPDLALADLVALFHPECLPNHEPVFFGPYEKPAQ